METQSEEKLISRIEELESRLSEAEQLIEAIKAGEVDAFALNKNNRPEIYTLQSGDYAYRVLVENFSEGALNLSEDGLIVYTNSSFHEMLGLTYENVIGKYIFQFIHTSSKETFIELLRTGLAGQSKGEINLVAGKKARPVLISLTSQFPTLPTVGMIISDLSEKKEQEKILKQSEEKFNKLFSASPLGLILTELSSGKIVDANEVYFETIGYSREECIGKTSLELNLVDKDARAKILEPLMQNGSVKNVEVELTSKSGKKIPVLNSIEKINIGNKEYFLSAVIDIIDRKDAERQIEEKNAELQKMNKELEAFTYISSHDLQEPLRKIQTFAGRILELETQNLSETGKDYFSRMQDAASRLQILIQDLLHFSRLATSERKFEFTDLNNVVDKVKEEFKETIETKNAKLKEMSFAKSILFHFNFISS